MFVFPHLSAEGAPVPATAPRSRCTRSISTRCPARSISRPDLLALFGLTATPAAASEADVALRPVTRRRLARDQYTRPPSFTDLLPWCEYLPEHRAFLLRTGAAWVRVLEITPVGLRSASAELHGRTAPGLLGMLSNVLEIDPSPWVVQVFVQDETDPAHDQCSAA